MSTTTPSSAAPTGPAHAAQANARSGAPGQRKTGHQDSADLFASMLSLLSATNDVPALPQPGDAPPALSTDPAAALQTPPTATPAGDATLAAMMQWAGLPQAGPTGRGAATATDTPAVAATDPRADALTARTAPTTSGPTDPMLQGMQVLERPEAPDAQTLAALSPPAAEPTAGPAETAATSADARPLPQASASPAHPSSVGRGQPPLTATHALQQSHHDATQVDRLQVRVQSDTTVALRSTVALDGRFSGTPAADTPAATLPGDTPAMLAAAVGAATGVGSASGTDLSGQPGGETDSGPQTSASDLKSADDSDSEGQADEDWTQAQDSLDAFAAPTLRQASLRVGEAGEDAIDIRLSLTGQELDLGFRTDSAEARAALVRHAESGLSELLQRGGIQLGDVSVGSQSGQSSGSNAQQAQPRSPTGPSIGTPGASADTEAAPIAALRPRRDGNRPLDLFV